MGEIRQLTEEEAIAFAQNEKWKKWPDETIALFQLHQDKLCVDFSVFHKAIETLLDRPVWTHEFADCQSLIDEYFGKKPKRSLQDIINLIPEEKRIFVEIKEGADG